MTKSKDLDKQFNEIVAKNSPPHTQKVFIYRKHSEFQMGWPEKDLFMTHHS